MTAYGYFWWVCIAMCISARVFGIASRTDYRDHCLIRSTPTRSWCISWEGHH